MPTGQPDQRDLPPSGHSRVRWAGTGGGALVVLLPSDAVAVYLLLRGI